jgi:hypothetical protein
MKTYITFLSAVTFVVLVMCFYLASLRRSHPVYTVKNKVTETVFEQGWVKAYYFEHNSNGHYVVINENTGAVAIK